LGCHPMRIVVKRGDQVVKDFVADEPINECKDTLIRVYQGLGHLSELHVGDARWIEIQLNE